MSAIGDMIATCVNDAYRAHCEAVSVACDAAMESGRTQVVPLVVCGVLVDTTHIVPTPDGFCRLEVHKP